MLRNQLIDWLTNLAFQLMFDSCSTHDSLKVAMLRNPLGKVTTTPAAPPHRGSGRPDLFHVVWGCRCRAPQAMNPREHVGINTKYIKTIEEKWRLKWVDQSWNRNEIQSRFSKDKLEAFRLLWPEQSFDTPSRVTGPVSLDLFCTRLPGQGPAGSDQCLLALKEDPEQVLAAVPVSADASPPLGPHHMLGDRLPPQSLAGRSRSSISEVVEAYDELVEVALLVSNATGGKTCFVFELF